MLLDKSSQSSPLSDIKSAFSLWTSHIQSDRLISALSKPTPAPPVKATVLHRADDVPWVIKRRADFTPCDRRGAKSVRLGHDNQYKNMWYWWKLSETAGKQRRILQALGAFLLGVIIINKESFWEIQHCISSGSRGLHAVVQTLNWRDTGLKMKRPCVYFAPYQSVKLW